MTKTDKITFFSLILTLSLASAFMFFLPMGHFLPSNQHYPISKSLLAVVSFFIVFLLYGGLGYVGLLLSKHINIPSIWASKINNKQRFFSPTIAGILSGFILVIGDKIFSFFHTLGKLPHPPFPTSFVASLSAGIGEELIFRLFFISFWGWVLTLIFKKGSKNLIFWILAIFSALLFSAGHLPSVLVILHLTSIQQIPLAIIIEVFVLNSIVALVSAYYFKKAGYLAAIGVHFWADVIWHVLYGFLGGLL